MIYIFWTTNNLKEAETIIHGLLEKKLVACASVFPEIFSFFRWKEKIEMEKEVKVLLKSKTELFVKISSYIEEHCSYDTPEIVMIEPDRVHLKYLQWLFDSVKN